MNKYVLGLDIGITSVGYGVIDLESNEFIDYGVRMFKEGSADENISRRSTRGRRRLTSRKRNRLDDMQKVLKLFDLYEDDFKPIPNIYEVRVKGLREKLTKEELAAAILHLTKHRGTSLETVEEDSDNAESIKGIIQQNSLKLKEDRYICEIQLEKLNNVGYVRGHDNLFRTIDYVNEMKALLDCQEVEEHVQIEILQIMQRKRAYYEGPGSENSPTPYGRFVEVNGEIQEIDLIEKMIGKCSVYPEELRAPKMSASAELFNFLNDLNNLTIENEKLTKDSKDKILGVVSKKGGITLKQLCRLLEVDEENVKGYRINKKGIGILSGFEGFKKLKNLCKNEGIDLTLNDFEFIDFIMEVVTKKKGIEERRKCLLESKYTFTDTLLEQLVKLTGVSGYHALSYKALRELNKELYLTNLNQMQLLHQLEIFDKHRKSHKGKKMIEADDTAILSPVVKRSIREAFKVVNALRKKYGEFESIVVEMTRDKNSKERKKRIQDKQKYFEGKNNEVNTLLKDVGYDVDKVNGKTKMKVRLYIEQHGKSAYTLQTLDLRRVIQDSSYTEIDHIIPISISLDDSINNKVLVTRDENQEKGKLTPVSAYQKGKFNSMGCTLASYIEYIKSNKEYSRKKKENLLYSEDITKFSEIQKFINRNLVDTSYACRVVLNTLSNYFKDNEIDTKVHTVNGKLTNRFRHQIQLDKDRNEDYLHHAVDGLIVASIKKLGLLNGYLTKYKFDELYDEKTGELKEIPDTKEFFDSKYISYILNLKTLYQQSNQYYYGVIKKADMINPPIKISHKVDTKANRQIADETIYSTRNIDGVDKVLAKVNIYDKKFKKLVNAVINHNTEDYLMKRHDPQTFTIIEQIILHHFEQFKNDTKQYSCKISKGVNTYELVGENPLAAYKEEHGYIKKYSKKGNGPAVVTMKYLDHTLGSHINVSKYYNVNDKKVILKQISPYRTDFYLCSNGKYGFVTIKYKDVFYKKEKDKYVIDEEWYEKEKARKKIDIDAHFICSIHRDELIGLTREKGKPFELKVEQGQQYHDGKKMEILKFTGTNDDKKNVIEVKPIFTHPKKQIRVSISSCLKIEKYATDILGNMYKVKENKLKLEFDKIS